MHMILVGGGETARELLRRLGSVWEVTLVDTRSEQMECLRDVRAFNTLVGDGSSRVVLIRAGLETADALVAATGDDDANLEACAIARDVGVSRVVALVNDTLTVPSYRERAVETVTPSALAARQIELSLEPRKVASKAFADGKAEAIEFHVAHDSPVRGRAIRDLHAKSFIVGAILRDDELVVPHGDTVLEAEDRVTVMGSGADFSDIVQTFTAGEARFPLDYGKRVAVIVEGDADIEGPVREAVYLVRNSQASSLVVVHPDPAYMNDEDEEERMRGLLERAEQVAPGVEVRTRSVTRSPVKALHDLPSSESVGMIVLPAPGGRSPGAWRAARRAGYLVRRARVPVLLTRDSQPYKRIVLPARRTPVGRVAVRAAIDLARSIGVPITGLSLVDPVFAGGDGAEQQARQDVAWLQEEAAAQSVKVHGEIRRGNPVKEFVHEVDAGDLLVLGVAGTAPSPFRIDVQGHMVRRGACSVLLVPLRS